VGREAAQGRLPPRAASPGEAKFKARIPALLALLSAAVLMSLNPQTQV